MNFVSLRHGNPLYIIYRSGECPRLALAEVVQRTEPHIALANQQAGMGMNMGQVVDLSVKEGERTFPITNLNPNAESCTYNGGQQFIACTRESALQEVDRMMAESRAAMERIAWHKSVLTEGEKMLETLNPRYAEDKAQKQDIVNLKNQMNTIGGKLDALREMMNGLKPKTAKT